MKNSSPENTQTDKNNQLDQVLEFLQKYKLSQYYTILTTEGFDRLSSLFDITENDLIALDVKRGHRRLLQRAIATARGFHITTPLVINYGYQEPDIPFLPKPGTERSRPDARRKRHKRYIPSKPITAFGTFVNDVRLEMNGQTDSDVLPRATSLWNIMGPTEKEKYEREALHANSNYVLDGVNLEHRYLTDTD